MNTRNRLIQKNDHWSTPAYIYDPLNEEFNFQLDPCPLHHDLSLWDGLQIDWSKSNFVNPPYSVYAKTQFILKGVEEKQKGNKSVFLIPVSTSTKLFHEVILPNISEPIRFVKGRIKFQGYNSEGVHRTKTNAMHDSMICIF